MDLPVSFPERPKFFVFSRGMTRDGKNSALPGIKGRLDGVGWDAVRWTSQYGNAAMVGFEGGATDGLNENGLAVLVLGESQHEPKDDRAELADTLWVQYALENFATVSDVAAAHRSGKFRVVGAWSTDLGDIYYINSATIPSLFWLELKKVELGPRAPLVFLDPHDPKIGGDARRYLKRWKAPI